MEEGLRRVEQYLIFFRPLMLATGDIVYVEAFGQPLLYVNSYAVAVDLLDKRSAIYSSRKGSYMT